MASSSFDLNSFPLEDVTFDLNELPESDSFPREDVTFDLNELPESEVAVHDEALEDHNLDDGVEHSNLEGEQQRRLLMISNRERLMVYNALLERSVNGKLKRDTTREVSSLFSVSLRTVQRIWKQAKGTPNGTLVDVSHRKTKNCGRKRIEVDMSRITAIPLNRRSTMRSIGQELNISHSTIHKWSHKGLLRRHSNAIKPYLKEEHKIARLQFCMSMLDTSALPQEPKFVDMYNSVHIDEKWFYMTKKSKNYYLLPDEEDPLRTCQSKNFIGKVMFLAAVARPRFDNEGNELFSGKIGVFPLVTQQPALRRSRNRDAGTLETKPITSVTKDIIRTFLIEKVIPGIQALWPAEDGGHTIFIQQDNARTHVDPNDEAFRMAVSQSGLDIRLRCQPANSPDLNVLDLGFFNAIQSLQDKERTRNVDELIHAVEKSFVEYSTRKLNHVFLTLQLCMKEIMRIEGCNRYKIPHINKLGLERSGCLPKQISCDIQVVEHVRGILQRRHE